MGGYFDYQPTRWTTDAAGQVAGPRGEQAGVQISGPAELLVQVRTKDRIFSFTVTAKLAAGGIRVAEIAFLQAQLEEPDSFYGDKFVQPPEVEVAPGLFAQPPSVVRAIWREAVAVVGTALAAPETMAGQHLGKIDRIRVTGMWIGDVLLHSQTFGHVAPEASADCHLDVWLETAESGD